MNKSFIIFSESWWKRDGQTLPDGALDEVMIASVLSQDTQEQPDDLRAEFVIRWYDLNGQLTPRLEMFEDAWHYLAAWSDLFKELAAFTRKSPTPHQIAEWLKGHGFADVTPREEPFIKP